MLELLAPAGSMEALRAAVQNGANAVYLGCGTYNARQGAKNFTPQTLTEAVKYCHIRSVDVHLALNTLVSDREMNEVKELIVSAAQSGVDAFIVQDLGVVQLCRQIAPHIPVHGSTQMTIHSLPGVQLCAAWGMTRVVLSRELSREEIRYICQNSPIEIEVFAHGALCMAYSGQCYLSAAIGGRSGNRGRCAQPCRQSYGYGRYQHRYPLSLKDNCLIHHLKELEDMGVASVKLEGRMKRPEYVAAVTSVYRKALDEGNVTRQMEQTLYTAFNRQGFTNGYYAGKIGPEMFGVREENTQEDPRWYRAMRQTYEAGEAPLVPITMSATVSPGRFSLTVTDPEGRSCSLEGMPPEQARNAALSEDQLIARLEKTGGTPYYCVKTQVELAPGMALSAAAINALRRDVLNMLTARRARRELPRLGRPRPIPNQPGPRHPELTVQVTSLEQITGRVLKMNPKVLYVPLHLLVANPEIARDLSRRAAVCAVLPRIVHDGEMPQLRQDMTLARSLGVDGVLAGNLALIPVARECHMHVRGDISLNLYNSGSVLAANMLELRSAALSVEMTLPQIRDVSKLVPCELLCYGRLPLMVTENCLIRGNSGNCSCHTGPTKLMDKTGADFPIIKDGNSCRSILLNGKKLYLLDRQTDLSKLGIWATRLYFTTENPKEVDRVLLAYQQAAPFDPGACTRGLYLRGLD